MLVLVFLVVRRGLLLSLERLFEDVRRHGADGDSAATGVVFLEDRRRCLGECLRLGVVCVILYQIYYLKSKVCAFHYDLGIYVCNIWIWTHLSYQGGAITIMPKENHITAPVLCAYTHDWKIIIMISVRT